MDNSELRVTTEQALEMQKTINLHLHRENNRFRADKDAAVVKVIELEEQLAESQAQIGYEQERVAHWFNETLVARQQLAIANQDVTTHQALLVSDSISVLQQQLTDTTARAEQAEVQAGAMQKKIRDRIEWAKHNSSFLVAVEVAHILSGLLDSMSDKQQMERVRALEAVAEVERLRGEQADENAVPNCTGCKHCGIDRCLHPTRSYDPDGKGGCLNLEKSEEGKDAE
ncbi:MAG: hypothetical protein Q7O66_16565 [Dehalococcoidia bacterium]|nr:hypothetical protein [Dehalococcoidia bacterium]